jgi:ankyrin repeat protein
MRILIQKCCNLKASSSNEFAPLHLAAFKGDVDMVALLLDHLSPEDVDGQGKPSLIPTLPTSSNLAQIANTLSDLAQERNK